MNIRIRLPLYFPQQMISRHNPVYICDDCSLSIVFSPIFPFPFTPLPYTKKPRLRRGFLTGCWRGEQPSAVPPASSFKEITLGFLGIETAKAPAAMRGKLAMGLRTAPQNPARGRAPHSVLLCARSALKMLLRYIFQGFPFLICCLTIFINGECRTGFDMEVKSVTVFRKQTLPKA